MEDYAFIFSQTVPARTYVDDIAQLATNSNERHLGIQTATATAYLAHQLKEMGLNISTKSQILSNSAAAAKQVADTLQLQGKALHNESAVVDLGLDVGIRRSGRKRAVRLRMTLRRTTRVKQLTLKRLRGNVFRAAPLAQASFGSAAFGCSRTLALKLRALHASMLGRTAGMCTSTFLALQNHDAWIDMRWRQMEAWLRQWRANPAEHTKWQIAWAKAYRHLARLPSSRRWAASRGPISSMITMLLEAGWDPIRATGWKNRAGPSGQ